MEVYLWLGLYYPGRRERSPDYQKLRARDTHVWGIRGGQPNRSAMEGSRPGGTALLITVAPTPGKYAEVAFDFVLGRLAHITHWEILNTLNPNIHLNKEMLI